MSIARGDRETILRRDKDGWHAWSNISSDIRRFERRGWTLEKADQYGSSFSAPDNGVSIRTPKKRKDAQRALTQERILAFLNANQNGGFEVSHIGVDKL